MDDEPLSEAKIPVSCWGLQTQVRFYLTFCLTSFAGNPILALIEEDERDCGKDLARVPLNLC